MISLHNNKRRIAVVTAWPPSPDNLDWPTALPYHLLQYAPAEVELHLFYFKGLEKHRAVWEAGFAGLPLASKTELQPYMGRRERWMYQLKNVLRPQLLAQVDWFPVRKRDVRAIQAVKPDGVWLYPHWLTPWVKPLGCANTVVTGPDSAILYHERWRNELLRKASEAVAVTIGEAGADQNVLAQCETALRDNLNLEKMLIKTGAVIHVVGQADADKFNQMAEHLGKSKNACFTPHPHYKYVAKHDVLVDKTQKIRVFVNGHAGGAYIGDHARRMTESLIKHADRLRGGISMNLVGKGWEEYAGGLQAAGFEVQHRAWVENYEQALVDADIALGLYAVGVGTKGKVLQAMAAGLLVIGSDLAFENIKADKTGYVRYELPEEIGEILTQIVSDRERFIPIAGRGTEAVRQAHSPEATALTFWKFFKV